MGSRGPGTLVTETVVATYWTTDSSLPVPEVGVVFLASSPRVSVSGSTGVLRWVTGVREHSGRVLDSDDLEDQRRRTRCRVWTEGGAEDTVVLPEPSISRCLFGGQGSTLEFRRRPGPRGRTEPEGKGQV